VPKRLAATGQSIIESFDDWGDWEPEPHKSWITPRRSLSRRKMNFGSGLANADAKSAAYLEHAYNEIDRKMLRRTLMVADSPDVFFCASVCLQPPVSRQTSRRRYFSTPRYSMRTREFSRKSCRRGWVNCAAEANSDYSLLSCTTSSPTVCSTQISRVLYVSTTSAKPATAVA
jgi:hypothetical protein